MTYQKALLKTAKQISEHESERLDFPNFDKVVRGT